MNFGMVARAMSAIAVLVPAALLGLSGSASADDYTPQLPTTCDVTVVSAIVGKHVQVRVEVAAAGAPTGTVEARFGTGEIRTVGYQGTAVNIKGPKAKRANNSVSVTFSAADPGRFAGCSDQAGVLTSEVGGADDKKGGKKGKNGLGGDNDAKGLPDTGGPPLALLLSGAGLVVVGGSLAARNRAGRDTA